jgi:hypothetical protein
MLSEKSKTAPVYDALIHSPRNTPIKMHHTAPYIASRSSGTRSLDARIGGHLLVALVFYSAGGPLHGALDARNALSLRYSLAGLLQYSTIIFDRLGVLHGAFWVMCRQ